MLHTPSMKISHSCNQLLKKYATCTEVAYFACFELEPLGTLPFIKETSIEIVGKLFAVNLR